ncbi:MAG: sigma 54-interacting transcriptional regulator, partial [Thermodesulfobacteriota bacterium]|nr:sigma 54-interacting transcriptional regulator [Thermodesulfobacteriota bacterium]
SIHIAAKENGQSFVKTNISEQLFKSVETDMRKYHREINRIIPYKGNPIFENEDGGTIYLEEIDTIPASFQGVLLQLFEGEQAKKIRVIASSHLKIDHLVRKGVFRKDLYFRLNVIKINIPPLRERKTDIPLLADFFANKFCMESGICHFQLSDRAKKAMTAYPWPNNIQELESFMTTDNFMGSEDRIIDRMNALIEENSRHGLDNLNGEKISGSMNEGQKRVSLKEISKKFASRIETEILKLVLEKTNWNRKQAAETLMISYKSLLNKIKAYNLN